MWATVFPDSHFISTGNWRKIHLIDFVLLSKTFLLLRTKLTGVLKTGHLNYGISTRSILHDCHYLSEPKFELLVSNLEANLWQSLWIVRLTKLICNACSTSTIPRLFIKSDWMDRDIVKWFTINLPKKSKLGDIVTGW